MEVHKMMPSKATLGGSDGHLGPPKNFLADVRSFKKTSLKTGKVENAPSPLREATTHAATHRSTVAELRATVAEMTTDRSMLLTSERRRQSTSVPTSLSDVQQRKNSYLRGNIPADLAAEINARRAEQVPYHRHNSAVPPLHLSCFSPQS